MDELRKNHILQINASDNTFIEGVVLDLSKDRILVLVDENCISDANKLNELDNIAVTAHTNFGIKKMNSSVISCLDGRNCILIENNPTISTIQRREHVRAVDVFNFKIIANGNYCDAKCVNLSGGGIAFKVSDKILTVGQEIEIILPADLFTKEIKCAAEIIKANDDFCVAKYKNLNDYDESKIVKRVFVLLAQK